MQGPGQRSLKLLRKRGYRCQVVERWNQFARVRQDLFGFIDILAMKCGQLGIVGIQTTTAANTSARIKKILIDCREDALLWLRSGNVIVVQGWKKSMKDKKARWSVTEREIKERDFR